MSYVKGKTESTTNNTEIPIYSNVYSDLLGNIYIKHKDIYYYVTMDIDSGLVLEKITNTTRFKKYFEDNKDMVKYVSSGVIKSGKGTLRGKISETIDGMNEEDKTIDDFANYDSSFNERDFYRVNYEDNEDDEEDHLVLKYYFNNVNLENEEKHIGLRLCDLCLFGDGTFDTIYIDGPLTSKFVVSTIERKDGYCTKRLTIYSDGVFKANFIGDSIKYFNLIIDENDVPILKASI